MPSEAKLRADALLEQLALELHRTAKSLRPATSRLRFALQAAYRQKAEETTALEEIKEAELRQERVQEETKKYFRPQKRYFS